MSAISAYGQSVQYSPYGNSSTQVASASSSDFLTQMASVINSDTDTSTDNSSSDASSTVSSSSGSSMQTDIMKILFEMLSNQSQNPINAGATVNTASSNASSLLQQKASSSYGASSGYGASGQSGGISFSA